ncbi:MAG: hypothetical protein KDA93_14585 [Planctomycetaceae bacterium]|nr:hypothetical protein [Planctomycetaceae bacterium]
MTLLASDAIWRKRFEKIDSSVEDLRLPGTESETSDVDQDGEWCEVRVDGTWKRVRFHDYDEVFEVPGLYEMLFYENLECCSPSCVVNLLREVAEDFGDDLSDFTVLDVGAGNGMVGDELAASGVDQVIGVDLIEEAKEATHRDRPGVYDEYLVTDLTDLPETHEETVRQQKPNCLTTVAALGFGDIPPAAFLKAVDLISDQGWLAFNIKESFLHEDDDTGFCRLIRQLSRERYIQTQCLRRYQHRLSIAGEPLHYVAMIAKKLRPLDDEILSQWQEADG